MSFLKPNRASQPAGRTTDRSLLLTPTKTIRNDKKLGERGENMERKRRLNKGHMHIIRIEIYA